MFEDTLTASYFLKTKAESWELNKTIFAMLQLSIQIYALSKRMKASVILKERSRWHNVTFPFLFFCRFGKVSFNFGTKFHWWNGNNCVVRY